MPDYKLYCLDGARRIQHAAEIIHATSDDDAVAQAKALDMPSACELWQGNRLVVAIAAAKP